jgi:hypothetical protein
MERLKRSPDRVEQDLRILRIHGYKEKAVERNQWRNIAELIKACTRL